MARQAVAGWYPDPTQRAQLRYFDGTQWTGYCSNSGVQFTDPQPVRAKPPRGAPVGGSDGVSTGVTTAPTAASVWSAHRDYVFMAGLSTRVVESDDPYFAWLQYCRVGGIDGLLPIRIDDDPDFYQQFEALLQYDGGPVKNFDGSEILLPTYGVYTRMLDSGMVPFCARAQDAVMVLGRPQSGKTSCLVIPGVLSVRGAVVSTSTKLDVFDATARSRSRLGRVWVFDPLGIEQIPPGCAELRWSPLWAARIWDDARSMAGEMVGASAVTSKVEDSDHWSLATKALLAPMLHAAALGGYAIGDVHRWITHQDPSAALETLRELGAELALDDLAGVQARPEKERSSIYGMAAGVLDVYSSARVQARAERPNFDADAFVRSADTVYITMPSLKGEEAAQLVVGLLSEIRDAAFRYHRQGRPPGAPAQTWFLDECANIAPIPSLPGIVSEAGGQGVQVVACFQDLAQARGRWHDKAEGFLTLFTEKRVFPGISDGKTLEALSALIGDHERTDVTDSNNESPGAYSTILGGREVTTSHSSSVSTHREPILSPGQIAQGSLYISPVFPNDYRVLNKPFYDSSPFVEILEQQPEEIEFRGDPDLLPLPTRPAVSTTQHEPKKVAHDQPASPRVAPPPTEGRDPRPVPAVRFCANCGNQLSAGDHFCSSCGTPVKAQTPTQPVPPAQEDMASTTQAPPNPPQ